MSDTGGEDAPVHNDTAPAAPDVSPDTVLAEGRLHPASLVLRIGGVGARAIVPAVIVAADVLGGGLDASSLSLLSLLGVLVAVGLGATLLDYWHFRYRLTGRELQITRGVLSRHERRIPLDRIQDLGSQQTLMRRVLGIVTVTVETASTEGEEANIDAIAPADAQRLREALQHASGVARTERDADDQSTLFRTRPAELWARGLTDNSAGILLAGALYALDQVLEFAGVGIAPWVPQQLTELLNHVPLHPAALLFTLVVAAASVFVAGWIVSAIVAWTRYYRFTLVEQHDVLQRRYGLFTTHVHSLPRTRIQCLRLEQRGLRALARLAVLRVDNAGSAASGDQEQQQRRSLFVPAGWRGRLEALVPRVLPGVDVRGARWRAASPKIVRRYTVRGVVVGTVVTLSLRPVLGSGAWWALLLAVPFVLAGWLAYRRIGYVLRAQYLGVRWGMVGVYRAVVPMRAVQSVELRRGPFERFQQLARIIVVVGGGASVTVPYLPLAAARRLLEQLSDGAAAHPFEL